MLTTLLLASPAFAPTTALNDTCATAEPGGSVSNTSISSLPGTLDPGSTDAYFKFLVSPGQRARISISFDELNGDLDLRLWNAGCTVLLDESATSGVPERTEWLNDTGAPAEVTAQVFTSMAMASPFEFNFRIRGNQELCDFADQFEPNDTCASAADAGEFVPLIFPLSIDPTDHDWIRFTAPPNSYSQITLLEGPSGDVDFELWSSDCSTLLGAAPFGTLEYTNELATPVEFLAHVFRADSDPECSLYSIRRLTSPGIVECAAIPNSTFMTANMYGIGTASVAADSLRLSVQGVPAGTIGLYVYGPSEGSTPLGNGTLCVGVNGLVRSPTSQAFAYDLDFEVRASMPAGGQPPINPGRTLWFQVWFRDPGDATGFGLSDALRVTFTP